MAPALSKFHNIDVLGIPYVVLTTHLQKNPSSRMPWSRLPRPLYQLSERNTPLHMRMDSTPTDMSSQLRKSSLSFPESQAKCLGLLICSAPLSSPRELHTMDATKSSRISLEPLYQSVETVLELPLVELKRLPVLSARERSLPPP